MNTLPNYIVQSPPLADPQSPPPFGFPDVGIQMFQVLADGHNLQAVCNRFFNAVATENNSPYQLEPIQALNEGIVTIMLLRYPKLICLAPGHEALGYSSQNELSVMIPVVLKEHGIPVNVGFFTPYLCVDNYTSLVTGREVIGFPKVGGEFGLSADLSEVNGTIVTSLLTNKKGPAEKAQQYPIFSAEALVLPTDNVGIELPDSVARPLWPYGPIDEVYATDQATSIDPKVLNMLNKAAGLTMGSYSLKQFRDAENPVGACYQALVAAETNIYQFHKGGLLPKCELTLHEYPHLDIIKTLGLSANGNKVTPINSMWYHASFNFENARNLVVRAGPSQNRSNEPVSCLPMLADGTHAVLKIYETGFRAWLRVLKNIADDRR